MQMPSLLKYFAFVGAALLALMSFANFLLEPSTGATVVAEPKKAPTVVVQHDPRASKVERWRNEQAALRSEAASATTTAAKSAALPASAPAPAAMPAVPDTVAAVAAPEPAPVSAPIIEQPTQTQPARLAATDTEATAADAKRRRVEQADKRKKVARAKAREKAARDWADSRRQDEFYYGQRPAYAFAPQPRQDFGPFSGSFGRGW